MLESEIIYLLALGVLGLLFTALFSLVSYGLYYFVWACFGRIRPSVDEDGYIIPKQLEVSLGMILGRCGAFIVNKYQNREREIKKAVGEKALSLNVSKPNLIEIGNVSYLNPWKPFFICHICASFWWSILMILPLGLINTYSLLLYIPLLAFHNLLGLLLPFSD